MTRNSPTELYMVESYAGSENTIYYKECRQRDILLTFMIEVLKFSFKR